MTGATTGGQVAQALQPLTAATQPSIGEIALGALPGLPKIELHWPLIDFECGPEYPRDGGEPDRRHGRTGLSGLGLESKAGIPVVCVPGCPAHPDNMSETILYLLYQLAGQAPMIPLDNQLRPQWLFGATAHEGCDRAGYYEQGEYAENYDSPKCLAKLGCAGQVVKCNVPKRGRINGVGGCPNVGGICIGCTMPGFPDKFMPFMDSLPDFPLSTTETYSAIIRSLVHITMRKANVEPQWRKKGDGLDTGYTPSW